MNKIQMVDLYNQYLQIKEEIDNAIFDVIKKSSFVKGQEITKFENELAQYLQVKHVIACGNGTDGLQIALMALDLQPGDEIITSTFTFIATAEVIALLRLKPVLVDIDPNTFLIDTNKIEKLINSRTKAIIPVHLFGQSCKMEEILYLAQKYSLFVIEDAAQSLGTEYYFSDGKKQKTGTIGHIGCTSFFPSKNLGCFGDGGAIFTNDDDLAYKIRAIANHGMIKKYHHEFIGVNSRLDSIQAAILSVKLKYLDEYHAKRQKAAEYYDKELKNISWIKIPTRASWSNHIFHQYSILVDENIRDSLKLYLEQHEIPTMIYYPVPIHKQKAYLKYNFNDNEFPVANKICKSILSLPMHTELANEQLSYICNVIKRFKQ
jgi:dTDP-4-amino-4,6-dideoxygalactose transaminase